MLSPDLLIVKEHSSGAKLMFHSEDGWEEWKFVEIWVVELLCGDRQCLLIWKCCFMGSECVLDTCLHQSHPFQCTAFCVRHCSLLPVLSNM